MQTGTLATLVALSRLDGTLRDLDRRIAEAPERLARIRERMQGLESELAALEQELASVQSRRRTEETEAETAKAKIAGYEQQLYAIKSNADYQAMLKQIAESKRRVDERETLVLELMEREEELEARLAGERARVDDLLGGGEEEIAAIEAQRVELERERQARTDEHRLAIGALDDETRRIYDRIHRGKGGVAVVAVEHGACGGCHSAMPPQHINEARLGTKLITCEACGRIVVWDDASSST